MLWQGAPLPPTPQIYDQRAAFSPDGARVLLVAAGSATRLYNVQTGQVEADLTAQAQIGLTFAFAPDSMRVASQIYDSNSKPVIVVWNIARNSREAALPVPSFERDVRGIDFYFGPGHKPSWSVKKLVYSPDGETLFVGLSTWAETKRPAWATRISTVSWAQVAALDARSGQARWQKPLSGPLKRFGAEEFSNFALSSDGGRLVCGVDGNTRLLDTRDGAVLQTDVDFPRQEAGFAPGGRVFFVASRNEARLYRALDGRFLGARALPGFNIYSPENELQPPRLSRGAGSLITYNGQFGLGEMWRRGYDWAAQKLLLRLLDGFQHIAWSPHGRAVTFDRRGDWGYAYRWNTSMTRIEARIEHPFREIHAAQLDADERTLWVWGRAVGGSWAEDSPFEDELSNTNGWPRAAAWKWNLESGASRIVWQKAVGSFSQIKDIALSPDQRIGAIAYGKQPGSTSSLGNGKPDLSLSQVQLFRAREGDLVATIPLPFYTGEVAISNPRRGGRLLLINRLRAYESRLFVLGKTPVSKRNAQIGGGWFFTSGSSDLFGGNRRLDALTGRGKAKFPNLNLRRFVGRGILASRLAPISHEPKMSVVVDRDGRELLTLPFEDWREPLLGFAPDGTAVTASEDGLKFWRSQKRS